MLLGKAGDDLSSHHDGKDCVGSGRERGGTRMDSGMPRWVYTTTITQAANLAGNRLSYRT